jgi:predicted nucleic acid-binding protein
MIDTIVLTMALGDRPHDKRAGVCRALWEASLRARKYIFIPAPCVAEMSRSEKPTRVPRLSRVFIDPFDNEAAEILGTKLKDRVLENLVTDGVRRHYIKYDALILATAIRRNATLVTCDTGLFDLGKLVKHEVKGPHEFLDMISKAEVQHLFLPKDRKGSGERSTAASGSAT